MRIKIVMLALVAAAGAFSIQRTAESQTSNDPEYTKDNQLVLPVHYREWIFLSSGLGMFYGPAENLSADRAQLFDNVFVTPAAYQSFLRTGKWPEKTMFVLEVRRSASKGSINNAGHYQSAVEGVEVEVKDSSRFSGNGWAFFGFGKSSMAKMIPVSASCYTCHPTRGAVDNTFVQFYPTLLPIAKQKRTLNPAYLAATAEEH